MTPKQIQDQNIARLIHEQGWLDVTLLKQGLEYLNGSQDRRDLLELIADKGLLDEAQILFMRQQISQRSQRFVALNANPPSRRTQPPPESELRTPPPVKWGESVEIDTQQQPTKPHSDRLESIEQMNLADSIDTVSVNPKFAKSQSQGQFENSHSGEFDAVKHVSAEETLAVSSELSQESAGRHKVLSNSIDNSFGLQIPKQILESYEELEEINRGAMGAIFKAIHTATKETVALKFIINEKSDQVLLKRFEREARALIQLKHRNVIKIVDFGVVDGLYFYAMEFIAGSDYLEVIQQSSPIPWRKALEVLIPIAQALAHIHKEGLCHRDVKPANILIEKATKRPVLADFGLVIQTDSMQTTNSTDALTRTGEMIGTPAYMAPEQVVPNSNYGAVGTATDVWAFSVVTYQAITGQLPFNFSTVVDGLTGVLHEDPLEPGRGNDLPPWLLKVLKAGLTKNAADRPTMADFIAQMKRGQKNHEIEAVKRIAVPVMIILFLVATLSILIPYLLTPTPLQFQLNKLPSLTDKSSVEVSGTLNLDQPVLFNGEKVEVHDGKFRHKWTLVEGENIGRIFVAGRRNESEQALTVISDRSKPNIIVDNESVFLNNKQYFILERGSYLRGSVKDDSKVSLTINLKRESVSEGKFEWLARSVPKKVTIKAVDQFNRRSLLEIATLTKQKLQTLKSQQDQGLKASQQVALSVTKQQVQRKQMDFDRILNQRLELYKSQFGKERFAKIEPLFSLAAWQKTSPEQREVVFKRVSETLIAKGFQWVSALPTKSPEGDIHIGRFQHKATGLFFHLIPGGFVFDQLFPKTTNRERLTLLHLLSTPYSSKAVLAFALEQQLPDSVRSELLSRFEIPQPKLAELQNQIQKLKQRLKVAKSDSDRKAFTELLSRYERSLEVLTTDKQAQIRAICDYFFRDNIAKLNMLRRYFSERHKKARSITGSVRDGFYTQPFLLCDIELTQQAWQKSGGKIRPIVQKDPLKPVHNISVSEVLSWLKQFPELRLPRDLEWKYAARGGSLFDWHWQLKPELLGSKLYSIDNSVRRNLRGSRSNATHRNRFGLWDCYGHVAELTSIETSNYIQSTLELDTDELGMRIAKLRQQWLLCGGSVADHSELCNNEYSILVTDPDKQKGIWGVRLAASIPWTKN